MCGKPGKGCPAEGCEHGHFPMLVVYERSERIPEPPRGSETCTAHKIQKSPYATIPEKPWGNFRQERKAGGDAAISTPPTVTGTYSPTADGVRSCLKSDGGNETWGTFAQYFHKAIIAGHWNVKGV